MGPPYRVGVEARAAQSPARIPLHLSEIRTAATGAFASHGRKGAGFGARNPGTGREKPGPKEKDMPFQPATSAPVHPSSAGLRPGTNPPGGFSLATALCAWVGVAFILTGARVVPALPPALAPVLILAPVVALFWASRRRLEVRRFMETVELRPLVLYHLVRAGYGAHFLQLWREGELPGRFALTAGIGDIIAGLLAIPVALLIGRETRWARRLALSWNLLALADILIVVATAQHLILVARDPAMTTAFGTFAFGLLPTVVVPLVIGTHLLIFARLVWWRRAPGAAGAAQPTAP